MKHYRIKVIGSYGFNASAKKREDGLWVGYLLVYGYVDAPTSNGAVIWTTQDVNAAYRWVASIQKRHREVIVEEIE